MRVLVLIIVVVLNFTEAQKSARDSSYEKNMTEETLEVKGELKSTFAQIIKDIPSMKKQIRSLNKENSELKKLMNSLRFDYRNIRRSRAVSHRTCYDWRVHGYTDSGVYLIDPDGKGVGEPPVHVFCDMMTGHTIVDHDIEEEQNISCSGNSCFVQPVHYNITRSQLLSLLEVSDKCRQRVEISCLQSPLFEDGEALSWWEDIHGTKQTSWSDSGCWCKMTYTCTIPRQVCNCDAALPERWLTDSGYITDASKLPVSKLVFGGGQALQIRLKLSSLFCYGQKVASFPQSCYDLWQSGHYLPGYYHIGSPSKPQLVFCNITHVLQKDSEPQLASTPDVMFYAGLSEDLSISGPVKYDRVTINKGEGYNASSGVFTAPVQGIYSFHVKSYANEGILSIKKNNVSVAECKDSADYSNYNSHIDTWSSISHPLLLELTTGDTVSVQLNSGVIAGMNKMEHRTVFTGFLISKNGI